MSEKRSMTPKQFRLALVLGGLASLGLIAFVALTALEDNLVFFKSPSDLVNAPAVPGDRLRIGGLVAVGSVARNGTQVRFRVTDGAAELAVAYDGMLPDLFREGQGVVAEGRMGPGGMFTADTVLAKHDETYMPPEVAEALKASGQWKGGK